MNSVWPARSRPYSSAIGSLTLSRRSASAQTSSALGTMRAPAAAKSASGIEEPSPADIRLVADIGRIAVEIGEENLDRSQLPDLAALNDLAGPVPLRVMADHEGLRDQHMRRDLPQLLRLLRRDGDRLLAQHVLAG